jgi:NCS1 family nucleobase:cation symporter-1
MPHDAAPELWNDDLAPTDSAHRNWRAYHYVALWIGMVVCIPSYMLASGLIDQGFAAWQAGAMVLAGNAIVLVPMLLNGHAGTRYGIPFPVLVRTSFGVRGAKLPALLRAIVACGWFGIQCWVGGSAIYAVGNIIGGGALVGTKLGWIGIDWGQLGSFMAFWALHLYFIARGPESVRWIESIGPATSAPCCTRLRSLSKAAGRRGSSGRCSGRPSRRWWASGRRWR